VDHSADIVPDHWLLQLMVGGDRLAAGELLRRHGNSLYALAYGVLWDSDVADAVVARAFAQARRTGASFRAGSDTVFAWLARITRLYAQLAATPVPGAAPRLTPLPRWPHSPPKPERRPTATAPAPLA
jgi:hypothetical protein